MKKKDIILISIIIILVISLITTIIYYNKNRELTTEGKILVIGSNYLLINTNENQDYIINTKDTNYTVGDKIKLELININKDKTPYEATAKNIILIKKADELSESNSIIENSTTNNDDKIETTNTNTSKNDTNQTTNKETNKNTNTSKDTYYTEEQVVAYFEDFNNQLTTYQDSNKSISETIKSKFVKCIDFIFYNEPIGGKTFSELTNTAKLKILSLALSIDSKIENYFPSYKESINSTYQNIKSSLIEKYLDITTNICNNDKELCQTAKDGFNDLKNNFGITWDLIKDLAGNGISKLKDWYEIWRYS